MKVPIYVINLKSSIDRAKSIDQQFKKLGIDYHLFSAINGQEENILFKKYNAKKHLLRKGRTLSKGELGCFASHYLLWKTCLEQNKAIIILEDDAHLTEHFPSFYSSAEKITNAYEFAWLHSSSRGGKYFQLDKIDSFSIDKYFKEYICATGYLITPSAAKKFLTYMEEWIYPVDDSMTRFYENGVENLAISPACIIANSDLDSTIGEDNRGKRDKKLTLIIKAKREYFNLISNFSRFLHNLKFIYRLKNK
ncbi:glycosyltransferase family 25 protein [Testudinibacter sp. TR-2022]|uniref:glycosyltransferase family 25 protein n=1 Tax=Testudinibacter sp. TR-2022 TaxID=2585029 RepID=UPI0011186188|nr:glycosyltransferase family 25 protein [Testudinibacter sp. TR-2022]TNH05801.1 glycosyltransferase family 25 protein [Pasteurellaceae bacterium Phil11]TNH24758.1 glycosyltransferase family 25 protein [Testudinibacter sp. TR-2022]TNH25799.1 glycosyltransferase family 25 protein [Testudinibacter sp. TR-2022]